MGVGEVQAVAEAPGTEQAAAEPLAGVLAPVSHQLRTLGQGKGHWPRWAQQCLARLAPRQTQYPWAGHSQGDLWWGRTGDAGPAHLPRARCSHGLVAGQGWRASSAMAGDIW